MPFLPAPLPAPPVILVVEDDRLTRTLLCDLFESAGFATVDACDADEALELIERRSDIELMFTDVVMPGRMDGLKLARCVRKRWPAVQLVVASGAMLVCADDLPAGARVFHKPYGAAAIVSAVTEMLQGPLH